MKLITIVLAGMTFLLSCNNSKTDEPQKNTEVNNPAMQPGTSFFPVTDFIKGQVAEIRTLGINPIKKTSFNNQQDSSWLKMEDLDNEFAPFLSPTIDSLSLAGIFVERSFLDQTIDAFTFTYDPVKPLPDSFLLQRWDVYVDPRSNTVRRIFLVKRTPDQKTLQLTWQTDRFCKMVYISKDQKGNDRVEKEVTIKWDF